MKHPKFGADLNLLQRDFGVPSLLLGQGGFKKITAQILFYFVKGIRKMKMSYLFIFFNLSLNF